MTMTPEETLTEWERHSHNQPITADDPRLPSWCPRWCTTNHRQLIAEGIPDDEVWMHSATAGEGTLDEIRNIVDHRVTRKGGGRWDVGAEQDRRNLETVYLKVDEHTLSSTGQRVTAEPDAGGGRHDRASARAHGGSDGPDLIRTQRTAPTPAGRGGSASTWPPITAHPPIGPSHGT